jgi:plasmid maintenance system antidote protein VapI
VPATRINDVVNERRGITADTSPRLARYFGTTAAFWFNLQSAFDLRTAEGELKSQIERDVLPRVALAGATGEGRRRGVRDEFELAL